MAWPFVTTSAMERRLTTEIKKVMSAIAEFKARFDAYQTNIETAVTGIGQDIDDLKKAIADLQASAGGITPEDQALLDEIEAKAKAISERLTALDALTPPVLPPA